MASFTLIHPGRDWTPAELTAMNNYITAQVSAGTTNGEAYGWPLLPADGNVTVAARVWSTLDAANGLITIVNGFSPAPANAQAW